MAQVPVYNGLQNELRPAPGIRQEASITPSEMAYSATRQGALSNAMLAAGNELMAADAAVRARQEAEQKRLAEEFDQLRVDDALNRVKEQSLTLTFDKEKGYTNRRGEAAMPQDGKQPLAVEYSTELDKFINDTAIGLGTERQRRLFAMRSNDLRTQFRGQVEQHEGRQIEAYRSSVDAGIVTNRSREIALFPGDAARVEDAVLSIRSSVARSARAQGKSAEWIEAETRKYLSNAHTLAIDGMLERGEADKAAGYLNRYRAQMDANDILKVNKVLDGEVDRLSAMRAVDGVYTKVAPAMRGGDFERAFNILKGTESNNRQVDDRGRTVTSTAGALGIAQIMPGTGPEAARLAGLPWSLDRLKTDKDYNEALGRAYFAEQLRTFGRIDLAYAAYNAGPGALQAALKKAESNRDRNDVPKPLDYLIYLPQETQGYVTKNMREFGTGGGTAAKPTLQEIHDSLREAPALRDRPRALKLALDDATRRYEDDQKATKQREAEGEAAAQKWLVNNGGRFSEIPPALRNAIPPGKFDDLLNFAARARKGEDYTDPVVYQKLATDPNYLRGLSDAEFYSLRRSLNEADHKHFANERGRLLTGKAGDQDINGEALNTSLSLRMRQMGIDPTPKDTDKAANERVATIRRHMRDVAIREQLNKGRKLTDIEIEQLTDKEFARQTATTGFFGGSNQVRTLGMTASDIPTPVRRKLEADFKARGVTSPSDADLLGAYWRGQSMTPRTGAGGSWQ
jgi:soluble lytic murein transglycosylase